jgi:hypothetical protein
MQERLPTTISHLLHECVHVVRVHNKLPRMEGRQAAPLCWHGPAQLVVVQVQPPQTLDAAPAGGEGPSEGAAIE